MGKPRVLVVEDSPTVRAYLYSVLSSDPDIEVIADAADGQRAVELCSALRPDVVTLDMMLPTLTGLAATEQIMAYSPTPILIVSSSFNRGELFNTYEALAAGAVDVLDGTGIGLSIVYRIIDRLGGRVCAESSPGHGATFYFTLPRPVHGSALH